MGVSSIVSNTLLFLYSCTLVLLGPCTLASFCSHSLVPCYCQNPLHSFVHVCSYNLYLLAPGHAICISSSWLTLDCTFVPAHAPAHTLHASLLLLLPVCASSCLPATSVPTFTCVPLHVSLHMLPSIVPVCACSQPSYLLVLACTPCTIGLVTPQ